MCLRRSKIEFYCRVSQHFCRPLWFLLLSLLSLLFQSEVDPYPEQLPAFLIRDSFLLLNDLQNAADWESRVLCLVWRYNNKQFYSPLTQVHFSCSTAHSFTMSSGITSCVKLQMGNR